jgi:hypothetical protein
MSTNDILRRLQGELALVESGRAAERERCARLAEVYGQRHLAQIIRTPACPHCFGIGYDASGQLCACQENPSF